MPKKIPQFKSVEEEIEFWNTHDSSEYLDGSDHVEIDFSGLKKTRRSRKPSVVVHLPSVVRKPRKAAS